MPRRKEQPDRSPLEVLRFHGVIFSREDQHQWQGHCPFCLSEEHFFANPETGQWDCKVCQESGNAYSFLEKHYLRCLEATTEENYRQLSALRDLPWKVFLRQALAWDPIQERWLIPVRNGGGRLVNLRVWDPSPESEIHHQGRKLLGTTGCKLHLFQAYPTPVTDPLQPVSDSNPAIPWNTKGPVYLCEGEWDAMAWDYLLRGAISADPTCHPGAYTILGVPGAGFLSSKKISELRTAFAGLDVIFLFDHDQPREVSPATDSRPARIVQPGKDGMTKACELLSSTAPSPSKLRWLDWDPEKHPLIGEEKCDIRDYISRWAQEYGKDSKPDCLKTIQQQLAFWKIPEDNLPRATEAYRPTVIRTKLPEVLQDFREQLYTDSSFTDAIRLATACVFSIEIPGDPIWMFLVGSPGSGKTTLVEGFGRSNQHVEALSKVTSKSLVSGWRTDDGEDVSFLPLLDRKTLVVKDYTAVLSLPTQVQEELYGMLRDIYDGVVRVPYGNNQMRFYPDLTFSCLFAVTDEIHRDNRSTLGERFLKVELLGSGHNEAAHIASAIEGFSRKKDRGKILMDSLVSFLDHTKERFRSHPERLPEVPEHLKQRLIALVRIISALRTGIARERDGGLLYRTRPEIGSRLATQLVKLGMSLAIMDDVPEITAEHYRLLQKVAFDTACGFPLEIARELSQVEYLLTEDLLHRLQIPMSSLSRRLTDMQTLGVLEQRRVDRAGRGRKPDSWRLSDKVRSLWEAAQINEEVVAQAPHPPEGPRRVRRHHRRKLGVYSRG
jgi:hypothetical protein